MLLIQCGGPFTFGILKKYKSSEVCCNPDIFHNNYVVMPYINKSLKLLSWNTDVQ